MESMSWDSWKRVELGVDGVGGLLMGKGKGGIVKGCLGHLYLCII